MPALTFFFPLQSKASKSHITQPRCLCPTDQDAGEWHTSVPLVLWVDQNMYRRQNQADSRGDAYEPGPPAPASEPAGPENWVASGRDGGSTQNSGFSHDQGELGRVTPRIRS